MAVLQIRYVSREEEGIQMVTRKKLHARREEERKERAADDKPGLDPVDRPRWKRHTKGMEAMLKDIDPARFEALADGH